MPNLRNVAKESSDGEAKSKFHAGFAHCNNCGWTWSGDDEIEAFRRAQEHALSCPYVRARQRALRQLEDLLRRARVSPMVYMVYEPNMFTRG